MTLFLVILLTVSCSACLFLLIKQDKSEKKARDAQHQLQSVQQVLEASQKRVNDLSKWATVADAEATAREMLAKADAELKQAQADASVFLKDAEFRANEVRESARQDAEKILNDARVGASRLEDQAKAVLESASRSATETIGAADKTKDQILEEARQRAKSLKEEAEATLHGAMTKAAEVIANANSRADAIAGAAMDAMKNAGLYEKTARAMKNIIEGYGDRYLVPAHSMLDELAVSFGHKEAGQKLKQARDYTKKMITQDMASLCDYVEENRKKFAEQFVLDAFNGKVDSILSRVKADNVGKLEQEIKDAFSLVNYNGKAFKDAHITDAYLAARLDELKWAAIAQQLKLEEQEEQRKIREQIREEQKAQREFERAMKTAAKEEEVLRNAMARAQAQIDQATAEQRTKYEEQLQELSAKLKEAEERNQRAISMAQQTRRGHVYVISNIGSLGEKVYKIGLTRRLDPLDRVRELGDSSVPFDFDVHALIFSEDAPALEHQLHKHFVLNQVNKVNHRKEFFRTDLSYIREEIEKLGIQAKWTMAADATEYRESQAIEQKIADDPDAREAWINRQLVLESTDPVNIDSDDDDTGVISTSKTIEKVKIQI